MFTKVHIKHLTTNFIDSVFLHEAGSTDLPGGHSKRVPPESISNSVVKTFRADDSAEEFRVKVGTAGHTTVQQPFAQAVILSADSSGSYW